jgi:hypothetical protein
MIHKHIGIAQVGLKLERGIRGHMPARAKGRQLAGVHLPGANEDLVRMRCGDRASQRESAPRTKEVTPKKQNTAAVDEWVEQGVRRGTARSRVPSVSCATATRCNIASTV